MRSEIKICLLLAIVFSLALLSIGAYGQSIGCCCDPVVKNGSFSSKTECDQKGFIFAGPPPSLTVTCSEHCNATLAPTLAGTCGDNICQPSETSSSCSADCLPLVGGCGSPTFRQAPSNLTVLPVKGTKELRLSYAVQCPADFVVISRCEGNDCVNFQKIAEVPPGAIFIDRDDALEFNKEYTYSVIAQYRISGSSDAATAVGSPGDLECLGQRDDIFCVSSFYYTQFSSYLSRFGYGQFSAQEFLVNFSRSVDLTFATRFNQGWQCDARNLLLQPSPQIRCDFSQFCVSDERGARCVNKVPCGTGFDPFGLYSSLTGCEGLVYRYCFFDKSTTVQDKCYGCDPRMTCYDYKSEDACRRDNCGAGDCQWNSVFDDLGTGVCVDKRYNNCLLCDKKGTVALENENASSAFWDACSEEKSSALSTALYPCFFDKDLKKSKGCDEATCADYTQIQCNAPSGGIKLNADNSLASSSVDACNIGVCEFRDTTGCVKNADGNTGVGFQDCKFGNETCELDYFPAQTSIIPSGAANRLDFLNIRIFDKLNRSGAPSDFAGKQGYTTFMCIKSPANDCADARLFPISTKSTRLIVKNGVLKEGQKTIGKFVVGNNTLMFFSKDAASNVEVVQQMEVFACDNCSGPTLLNISVSGGRVLDRAIFTSNLRPSFVLDFDEPTFITFFEINRPETVVRVSQKTAGFSLRHEFAVLDELDGVYELSLNGNNERNIFMDSPGLVFSLLANASLAGVTIIPAHGSILQLNKTSLDVQLDFTDQVTLTNISLVAESYADPFVKRFIPRDITVLFKTSNNRSFKASVPNVSGGGYRLVVDALGFNSLQVYRESHFFIATQKPSMRLVAPTFGVTAFSVFNVSVETPLPSVCSYVYDTPTPPSSEDFDFFNKMDGSDVMHSASGLSIPFGSAVPHPLHVYCKFNLFGVVQRSFNLTLDPEPVVIKTGLAAPSIISEQFIPGEELFVTTLKAELDKEGFCKFSRASSSLASMEGFFPGFDSVPKISLGADVNVSERKSFSYFVTCKGKNGLASIPYVVNFSIDLSLPLVASSSTPRGFPSTNFTIGMVANKRVFCYFGEQEDDTTRCMGACRAGYTHAQQITVPSEGSYTYFAKCAHVSGEQSEIVEIPVLVDTSAPQMEFVDSSSSLEGSPDITWSLSKIRVAFRGKDDESGISHYLVSLKSAARNRYVFRDLVSNVTDGRPFYISQLANGSVLRLNDGETYSFEVKAVNPVGLASEAMESEPVIVDSAQRPLPCGDGEVSGEESDVDCGGACEGCVDGLSCGLNSDCASNYCESGKCDVASCEDSVVNGLESDVDCGGQACAKCLIASACIVASDCETNYCDPVEKLCAKAPPCADGALSEGESDVDCGGSCAKCSEGKACAEAIDCDEGLSCDRDAKACVVREVGDSDGDGVFDDVDACLGSPLEETVDETGCAPSQTFSLGDSISDKWRMDYFGCIDCPEAAASADPDNDGLTNEQEFFSSTNPTKNDTDGDGWNDGSELDKGTDPTDPASKPSSLFVSFLYVLFIVFAVGVVIFVLYRIL